MRSQSTQKNLQINTNQIHKYNPSVTLELYRKNDSIAKENPEFVAPKPRLQLNGGEKKADRKATSKILIS